MEDEYRKEVHDKEVHDAAENLAKLSKGFFNALDFESFFKNVGGDDQREIAAIVYKHFSGHRYMEIDDFADALKRFNHERIKERVCDYDKEKWSYEIHLQKMIDMHDIIDSRLRKLKEESKEFENGDNNINQGNNRKNILDKLKSFLD